jgi:hypothetical protein
MPGPLTGGAADNLGQEVLDAIERVLSAPEEVRILCAVTFLETVQQVEERADPLTGAAIYTCLTLRDCKIPAASNTRRSTPIP